MLNSILIIDDEQLIRDMIALRLSKLGYMVNLAESGEQGLEMLQASYVDMILLDLNMPGLNGLEFLATIKASVRHNCIPVIVITADSSKETVIQCLKKGAMDYLVKPLNLQTLKTRLWRYFENKRIREGLLTATVTERQRRVLLVEDNAMNANVIKHHIAHQGIRCDHVLDGASFLQVTQIDQYDAVLFDINLPDISGDELLRRLRAINKNVAVIMLSANDSSEIIERCLQDGADDYITKPIHPFELKLRIEQVLSIRDAQRAEQAQQEKLAALDQLGQSLRAPARE